MSAPTLRAEFRAMASPVVMLAAVGPLGIDALRAAVSEATATFHAYDAQCTRFDPHSALMSANRAGGGWCTVPQVCFDALREAKRAHDATSGRFDPRVLDDLVRLGYDHSRRHGAMSARPLDAFRGRDRLPQWQPEFRDSTCEVRLGTAPIDLGGIAKGLAVRAAGERLATATDSYLVEAGGDCACAGDAPEGGPWRLAVEDPRGGSDPVAVLALHDAAVATSSTRICSWTIGDVPVHHLIDPTSGKPGGDGLAAVTVVAADPAISEVWSKTLFLAGRTAIREAAERAEVAALWIDTDGTLHLDPRVEPYVIWRAS
jgi:thiamine biosynthesis lipoprotein